MNKEGMLSETVYTLRVPVKVYYGQGVLWSSKSSKAQPHCKKYKAKKDKEKIM